MRVLHAKGVFSEVLDSLEDDVQDCSRLRTWFSYGLGRHIAARDLALALDKETSLCRPLLRRRSVTQYINGNSPRILHSTMVHEPSFCVSSDLRPSTTTA